MRKANKLLSILLALALCLSLLPTAAFAEGEEEDTDPTEITDPTDPTDTTDTTENPGDAVEEHSSTTVTIDTTDPEATVTVENNVTPGTPTPTENNGTSTTDTWENKDNNEEDDTKAWVTENGAEITVEGSETTTQTPETNAEGVEGTRTSVEGNETITVTMPERPAGTSTDHEENEILAPDDVTWNDGGWEDVAPLPPSEGGDGSVHTEPPAPVVPMDEDGVTVVLTPGQETTDEVAVLDWETFVDDLIPESEDLSEEDQGKLNGLKNSREDGETSLKGGSVTVTVSEEGEKVTVTEYVEGDAVLTNVPSFEDGTAVELTEADLPEGTAAENIVRDEAGNIIGYKTVGPTVNGSTTTVTTYIAKTEANGEVRQTRQVKTTTYDLTNADLKLWGQLGGFTDFGAWQEKPAEDQPASFNEQTLGQLMVQSGVEGLSKEDAQAAIDAVLNQDPENPVTLEGAALAFFEYLTLDGRPVETEPAKPVISEATVTVTPKSGDETSGPTYTAEVNFTVQMTPSVTGDLLVKIAGEEGQELIRVQTDGNAPVDELYKVEPLGDGVYKVTIYNVRLSSATEPVDLEIIANEETLTRSLAVDGTITVPGSGGQSETPPPEDLDRLDESKVELGGKDNGNITEKNWLTYPDPITGEPKTSNVSEKIEDKGLFKNGGELDIGGGTVSVEPISETEGLTFTNNSDQVIHVDVIAIKAASSSATGGACIFYYSVPGGVLLPGQTINMDGVHDVDPNGNYHAISHICLIGVGAATTPEPGEPTTESTYKLTETLQTRSASATLSLNLTGGVVEKTENGEKDQIREGTATVTQTALTTQEQIVTERNWSDPGEFIPNEGDDDVPPGDDDDDDDTPPSPPPGDDDDDDDDTPPSPPPGDDDDDDDDDIITTVTPGDDDDDDDDTATITDAPTPLADTPAAPVAAPVTEIADEIVPLAEIPEMETPLAEAPEEELEEIIDEEVPLADVPETGDASGMWYAVALTGLCGLAALSLKKREEEEA